MKVTLKFWVSDKDDNRLSEEIKTYSSRSSARRGMKRYYERYQKQNNTECLFCDGESDAEKTEDLWFCAEMANNLTLWCTTVSVVYN